MDPEQINRNRIGVKTTGWVLILLFAVWITGLGGILSGKDGDPGRWELTLDEARALARENNPDLLTARLSVERIKLALDGMEEALADAERRREELGDFLDEQEAERERVNLEIEELEEEKERLQEEAGRLMDELEGATDFAEYRRAVRELQEVQRKRVETEMELLSRRATLTRMEIGGQGAKIALQTLDAAYGEQNRRKQELRRSLESGVEFLTIQEEAVLLGVESMYTALLIIQEQEKLQQEGHTYLLNLLSGETKRETAGYSTPLEVEKLRSGLRDSERRADQLERKRLETLDRLCLTVGLSPGTELSLVPFTPDLPGQTDLEQAVREALESGYLVKQRRERVENRKQELQDIAGEYGEDSLQYRLALLEVEQAELQLRQAGDETRVAVREAFWALKEAEREIDRSAAEAEAGELQSRALEAQLDAGYITPAQAGAASLNLITGKAALFSARYSCHLARAKFELARRGYIWDRTRNSYDF